jgi:hypothetical protein
MGFIQHLDLGISVESFEQRKRFQKIVYMAQEMEIDLGFNFGWYRYGPYSKELADDGFTAFSIPTDKWDEYAAPSDMSDDRGNINRLREIIDEASKELDNLDQADVLEILASLLFLKRKAYPAMKTMKDAIKRLSIHKSFSSSDAKKAWKLLAKHQLV